MTIVKHHCLKFLVIAGLFYINFVLII